jgi:hypothetical protein
MLRFAILLLFLACTAAACTVERTESLRPPSPQRVDTTAVAEPDVHDLATLVTASSSEAELIDRLGAAVVQPDSVHVGEGFFEAGTVLHPDDPTRRAFVLWTDSARETPERVLVRDTVSVWEVAGVRMGTTLGELEERNGGPVRLAGFGWDYSGTVTSWEGGALGSAAPRAGLFARLEPNDWDMGGLDGVLGDGVFPSTHPTMRRINPRVVQFGLDFR